MPLTNKQFMTLGMYLFLVVAIANLFTFLIVYDSLILPQKVAQFANVLFNFLLAYMFNVWRNQQADLGQFPEYKEPDNVDEEIRRVLKEDVAIK